MKTILISPIILLAACVEPYILPNEKSNTQGFLVIDGYLDGVKKTGTVRLSRSIGLGDASAVPEEKGASVSVEDAEGNTFKLDEGGHGIYQASGLPLVVNATYRLHVTTADGSNYSSDDLIVRQTPSFDSLFWLPEDDGIHFYVNSHDDNDLEKYYRYSFTETWEYRASVISRFKTGPKGYPVKRKDNEFVDICWAGTSSSSILIISTTAFTKNEIENYPIHFIRKGSRMLQLTYSILVEQRSMSQDEYAFWNRLQKSSESLGGLFDPIPGQVIGNMHNDEDPGEPVLGFFSGGFPREKRIFINYDDLPKALKQFDALDFQCAITKVSLHALPDMSDKVWVQNGDDPTVDDFYITTSKCGDCRYLGGDTIKPKFWPQ